MRIKNEIEVKGTFVVIPKKCKKCGDTILLEKMIKKITPGRFSTDVDYYCTKCVEEM